MNLANSISTMCLANSILLGQVGATYSSADAARAINASGRIATRTITEDEVEVRTAR